MPYLWPEGQFWVKWRVVAALAVLVLAKLIAVATPIFYKQAVDALARRRQYRPPGCWPSARSG